jgi:hypothetical protein
MAHFADPSHWRSFYARRCGGSFEWYVDAAVAMRAIAPRLAPRSRLLHAGCGTSELGSLLAARGHRVDNVDFEPTVVAAARTLHQHRATSAFDNGHARWRLGPAPAASVRQRAAPRRSAAHGRAGASDVHSACRPRTAGTPALPVRPGRVAFHCCDLRQLPKEWTGAFDAVIDKGGLCAAARGQTGRDSWARKSRHTRE